MTQTISLLARLIDTLAPRPCTICGRRLTVTEEVDVLIVKSLSPRRYWILSRVMIINLCASFGVGFP